MFNDHEANVERGYLKPAPCPICAKSILTTNGATKLAEHIKEDQSILPIRAVTSFCICSHPRMLIANLVVIIDKELLPNAANICIKDFQRLNETLIAARAYLRN